MPSSAPAAWPPRIVIDKIVPESDQPASTIGHGRSQKLWQHRKRVAACLFCFVHLGTDWRSIVSWVQSHRRAPNHITCMTTDAPQQSETSLYCASYGKFNDWCRAIAAHTCLIQPYSSVSPWVLACQASSFCAICNSVIELFFPWNRNKLLSFRKLKQGGVAKFSCRNHRVKLIFLRYFLIYTMYSHKYVICDVCIVWKCSYRFDNSPRKTTLIGRFDGTHLLVVAPWARTYHVRTPYYAGACTLQSSILMWTLPRGGGHYYCLSSSIIIPGTHLQVCIHTYIPLLTCALPRPKYLKSNCTTTNRIQGGIIFTCGVICRPILCLV